jgi:pyruvate kinase
MLRTKIVCTLGPASDDKATLRAFAEGGMAVARINFSHGTYQEHARRIRAVRRVAGELGRSIAIMADLQGPKLRVGLLPPEGMSLVEGKVLSLTNQESSTDPAVIPVPHPEVLRDTSPGDRILLDDGLLELQVIDNDGQSTRARVVTGGMLTSRKGLSLPHTSLKMPSVTDKDKADAAFALEQGVDYFALSFVRGPDDVAHLRAWIRERGADVPIISKIEKPEALDCIEEILAVSDGMMVARGDLGVETPPEEVPIAQKRIIRICNEASKPVITATQMLDSMMRNPRPTRAEASDVANAILDGSDAIMLSGETAVGRYAVESVQTMARIAAVTERSMPYQDWLLSSMTTGSSSVMDAIAQVACEISADLDARAIIASTVSGSTARRVASRRPATPIVAPTPSQATYHRLALVWGVVPVLVDKFDDTETMIVTVAHRVGEEKGWR